MACAVNFIVYWIFKLIIEYLQILNLSDANQKNNSAILANILTCLNSCISRVFSLISIIIYWISE